MSMAQEAYDYTAKTVSGLPMPDDVSPHLAYALQTGPQFCDIKDGKKLRAKHYFKDFADLIIARTWGSLKKGTANK
jgi:hypothetical protein